MYQPPEMFFNFKKFFKGLTGETGIGMVPVAPFKLRIENIDAQKLIELQGERGPFYVCNSGEAPGLHHGLFYGDSHHQFCFYTKVIFDRTTGKTPATYDLEVYYATAHRLSGTLPKMPKEDAQYLERNIIHWFRTRNFFTPSRLVNPNDSPREIRFIWKISL